MVNRQNLINIKPVSIFMMIAFVILSLLAGILIWNKKANEYKSLNFQMKLNPTTIYGNEGYGVLRGAVFYKEGHFITTSAKFVETNCKSISWETNGPIIDFNNKPHQYKLDDLGLPYIVFKEANNDTLNVKKDGCVLKFLLR